VELDDGELLDSGANRRLDELVHALYDLTPEEIKIVEGKA